MVVELYSNREKAIFQEHQLWVARRPDGNWQIWIEGQKQLLNETTVFGDRDEAKSALHQLAHWHLEQKQFCDCKAGLSWEFSCPEEMRKFKRFNYSCEILAADRATSIGRMVNVSVEGAFIRMLHPPSKGSIFALSFKIGRVQIQAEAEVVHIQPNQGVGVRFLTLADEGRKAIAALADKVPVSG